MRPFKHLIPALMLTLGCLGLLEATAADKTPEQKPLRITMMLFRGCEESCLGFQSYFRQQGVPVEFTLRDAAQDRRKVSRFVKEIVEAPNRPDLVVTWGTSITQDAVGTWKDESTRLIPADIPVVFMVVSDPVDAGILKDLDTPRPNMTGSLYLLPLETQLQAASSYMTFHKVGYLLNRTEANSVGTLRQLREQTTPFNFELLVSELPLTPAGKPDASKIPGIIRDFRKAGVDMIYQGPDTFLNVRRDLVTDSALAQGIPVFAAAEAPVQHSRALFGVVNRYWDVGRFTAAQAVKILRDGKRPEDIKIALPRKFSYLINLPVALQLKRYPPLKLLDVAEITGLDHQEQP